MVSCQKGPTRHAYAWQIGPFWQDTLELLNAVIQRQLQWNISPYLFTWRRVKQDINPSSDSPVYYTICNSSLFRLTTKRTLQHYRPFVMGIHQLLVHSMHKEAVTWKVCPCHEVIRSSFKYIYMTQTYHKISNIRPIKSQNLMIFVSSCSCLCPIHWRQVLSRE